jgi:uncharacterized protein YkwD
MKKHQRKLKKNQMLVLQLVIIAVLSVATIYASQQTMQQQNVRSNAQTANCAVAANELAMTASEQELLSLINAYRQQNGAPALVSQPQLKQAAEWLSHHMATGGPFDHTDGLGRAFFKRLADCGYTGKTTSENIAENSDKTDSAAKTFDQWKNSPGHNTNMLNPKYVQIGIAEFVSQDGTHYWTFDAGAGGSGGAVPTAKPQPTAVPTKVPTKAPTQVPPTAAPVPTNPTNSPSGGTNPTNSVQLTQPENPTPTFTCLGACITEGPTPNEPTIDPVNQPADQTQNPSNPGNDSPGTDNGGGGQTKTPADQNVIVLILLLIIQIIRGLFGGY